MADRQQNQGGTDQAYLRKQVDWPQAFSADEYAERRRKVRTALSAKSIDAIYITTSANLTYLTGYDMIWYHMRNLTGLLLRADSEQTVWFDGVGHTTIVSTTPSRSRTSSGSSGSR